MRRREFLKTSTAGLGAAVAHASAVAGNQTSTAPKRKILIAGGGFNTAFIRYMATLTGKGRPRICYLPTANADSPAGSISWFSHVLAAERDALSSRKASLPARSSRRAGKKSCSRWTRSSHRAATR
jgi:hypothetical protein